MNKQKNNQQLVNSIIFCDIINDSTAIAMAQDLHIMTYSKCCMKQKIDCWENIQYGLVVEFEEYCAECISSAPVSVQAKWNDMIFEDQIQIILGDDDCSLTQTCSCTCVTNAA